MSADQPGPEYTARHLVVLEGAEAVRQRLGLYFGVGRDDRSLPERVLRLVVHDALYVQSSRDVLEVSVTIEDDLIFCVRDDGRGADPFSRYASSRPDLERILTDIHGGNFGRSQGISIAGAVCSRVTIRTCWEGVGYATEMAADRSVRPVEELGPSSAEGTEVRMWLNADFFAPGSRLPNMSHELEESLLAGRQRTSDRLFISDSRSK